MRHFKMSYRLSVQKKYRDEIIATFEKVHLLLEQLFTLIGEQALRDNDFSMKNESYDYFSKLNNDNLNPVGRLDRETTGLLLITDDGVFNQKLTHPSYHKEKTYHFTVLGDLTENRCQQLEKGILLKGSPVLTSPAKLKVFRQDILSNIIDTLHPEVQSAVCNNLPTHPVTYGEITISEGRKRQIRRMMKAVHCCVIELKRISIEDIILDETLSPGEWKEIFPL